MKFTILCHGNLCACMHLGLMGEFYIILHYYDLLGKSFDTKREICITLFCFVKGAF